jgi:hypothetical protein
VKTLIRTKTTTTPLFLIQQNVADGGLQAERIRLRTRGLRMQPRQGLASPKGNWKVYYQDWMVCRGSQRHLFNETRPNSKDGKLTDGKKEASS